LVPVSNGQKGGALVNVDPTYIIPVEQAVAVVSDSRDNSSSGLKQAKGTKQSAVETVKTKKTKKKGSLVKAKPKNVSAKRKGGGKAKRIKTKNGFVF
jgi:hypothetical protein